MTAIRSWIPVTRVGIGLLTATIYIVNDGTTRYANVDATRHISQTATTKNIFANRTAGDGDAGTSSDYSRGTQTTAIDLIDCTTRDGDCGRAGVGSLVTTTIDVADSTTERHSISTAHSHIYSTLWSTIQVVTAKHIRCLTATNRHRNRTVHVSFNIICVIAIIRIYTKTTTIQGTNDSTTRQGDGCFYLLIIINAICSLRIITCNCGIDVSRFCIITFHRRGPNCKSGYQDIFFTLSLSDIGIGLCQCTATIDIALYCTTTHADSHRTLHDTVLPTAKGIGIDSAAGYVQFRSANVCLISLIQNTITSSCCIDVTAYATCSTNNAIVNGDNRFTVHRTHSSCAIDIADHNATVDCNCGITLNDTSHGVVGIINCIIIRIEHIRTATAAIDITTVGVVVCFIVECFFGRISRIILIDNDLIAVDSDCSAMDGHKGIIERMPVFTTTIDRTFDSWPCSLIIRGTNCDIGVIYPCQQIVRINSRIAIRRFGHITTR